MSIDFTVGTLRSENLVTFYQPVSEHISAGINWANGNAYRVMEALEIHCEPCGTLPIRQARLLIIGAADVCDKFDQDMLDRLNTLGVLVREGILAGATHLGWG